MGPLHSLPLPKLLKLLQLNSHILSFSFQDTLESDSSTEEACWCQRHFSVEDTLTANSAGKSWIQEGKLSSLPLFGILSAQLNRAVMQHRENSFIPIGQITILQVHFGKQLQITIISSAF